MSNATSASAGPGADSGRSGSGHGSAAGFVVGFAPWIVYWILTGNTSFGVAIGVAFGLSVVVNAAALVRHGTRGLKVLEVGNTIAFVVLALVGLLAGDAFVERWIQPLGNAALLTIMLVSVLVGKPFTLQYAQEATDPALWDTPGFLVVNRVLTWVWVGAMAVMTLLSMIPPIVQGDATMRDGGSPLSIACYWVLPYVVMGLAIIVTVKYPDWFGAEFDDVTPVAGATRTPLPTSGVEDHAEVGALTLAVEPERVLADEVAAVTVTGAQPGAVVELAGTTVDLMGNVWTSSATFHADGTGRVDTSTDAPTAGDYTGVDATGLVWGMRFATPGATPDIYVPGVGPSAVAIEARVGGTTLTTTLVRCSGRPDLVVRDVHTDAVVGRSVLPPAGGPHPGLVLFGGSEGGIDSQQSNAELLASHGFAVLIAGYFGMAGLPDQLVRIPLERLADGVAWLRAHPQVDGARVGALAISRGSEGLLSMASRVPDVGLQAIAVVSPSSVSWTAMGDQGTEPGVPSWTVGGEPVPHLDVVDEVLMEQAARAAFGHRGRNNPLHPHVLHLRRAYAAALGPDASDPEAAIPVERIAAPLLCLSGGDDQVWPSGPMSEALLARRRDAGRGAGDHHEHHAAAGHLLRLGCLPTDVAATGGIALGGTRAGTAAAQADTTSRILGFFGATLG